MDAVFWVRVAFIALCATAAWGLVRKQQRVVAGLREQFLKPDPPLNLALLRVAIFGMVLYYAVDSPAVWYAEIPLQFRRIPRGWEWLEPILPGIYGVIRPLRIALIVSSAFATVGLFTRPAMVVSSALATFVLAVPLFYFKLGHAMHAQMLIAFVLSVSPSGDAVSVDEWFRRRRGKPPFGKAVAYRIPVRLAWLLIGTAYLFPGLWKLWESGDQWMNGSALKSILVSNYGNLPDFYPILRADHSRLLLVLMGTSTLIFEIGYFFGMFSFVARPFFAIGIAAFHVGVGLTLRIWFDPLFPLLPLLDFPDIFEHPLMRRGARRVKFVARWRAKLAEADPAGAGMTKDSGAAPFVVGTSLVWAMTVAGLVPVNSWPVSTYPLFSARQPDWADIKTPPRSSVTELLVRNADHSEVRLTEDDFNPLGWTVGYLVDLLVKANERHDRRTLKRGFPVILRLIRENRPDLVKPGATVVICQAHYAVDPDDRKSTKPEREDLLDTPL